MHITRTPGIGIFQIQECDVEKFSYKQSTHGRLTEVGECALRHSTVDNSSVGDSVVGDSIVVGSNIGDSRVEQNARISIDIFIILFV